MTKLTKITVRIPVDIHKKIKRGAKKYNDGKEASLIRMILADWFESVDVSKK